MAEKDKRKQSLYFPEEMMDEIQGQAIRLDRSLSWVVQRAWEIAKTGLARYPSIGANKTGVSLPRPKVELPDPYLHELMREKEEKASKK